MSVNRNEKYTRILVEDFLSRVSMMGIPVEDGNLFDFVGFLSIPSSCGHVVEKAETTDHTFDSGMMAWRSHCSKAVFPLLAEEVVDADLHRSDC